MWSPPKPWEISSSNFRNPSISSSPGSYRPARGIRHVRTEKMTENNEKSAPAIPPRPGTRQSPMYTNYGGNYAQGFSNGYMAPYSGGYMNGYGGYSGYNGYNNMYGGYASNNMGYNSYPTSSFVEQAEQNSRIAFDSVHSIVQAFGSIAMMLESTFFAVHSSFRAVLGVADHFSRLRDNLIEIVGSNFLIKWLKSVVRKIMFLIGLRSSAGVEEVWNEMRSMTSQHKSKVWKSWPLLLFFGVVLGTPWLIWKFLSSLGDEEGRNWMTGDGDHVLGEALYDFVGERDDELSMTAGEFLRIAPKQRQPKIRGWLLATVDGKSKGIVPANYIKILGFKRGKKVTKEQSVVSKELESNTDGNPKEEIVELENIYTESCDDFNTVESGVVREENESDQEMNTLTTSRTLQQK